MLDVGCGSGLTARTLAALGAEVVGIDTTIQVSESGHDTVSLIEGDYLEHSVGLGSFDFVMALDSVEHFRNESAIMGALASNTYVGGRALITVPAYGWLWSSHDETNMHYRRYTRATLKAALSSTGFSVDRVGYLFPGLVPPKAGLALLERVRQTDVPSGVEIRSWANASAKAYFHAETKLGARLRNFWPFGTSVVALATRLPR